MQNLDPIQIRPRLHRQSPSMRELRTKKTRTPGSKNVLPRPLTRMQVMWLLDLRERSDERQREHKRIVPLELALEHKIVAQRLSGRWYFAGLPDA
jgi:hypothetical protein